MGKARISRILENAKYTGDEEFETIIDEDIYEEAVAVKSARRWNQGSRKARGHPADPRPYPLRTMRCDDASAYQFQTRDPGKAGHAAMQTVAFGCGSATGAAPENHSLMNRVIANADLMLPHPKVKPRDSAVVLEFAAEDLRRNGAGASREGPDRCPALRNCRSALQKKQTPKRRSPRRSPESVSL